MFSQFNVHVRRIVKAIKNKNKQTAKKTRVKK